jgi:hypothetical protein
MEENLLTLIYKNIDPSKIGVNPEDADKLDLEVGDVCEFVDVDTEEVAAAKVLIHKNIPTGTFVTSEELASSIGAEEGFQFALRRYKGELQSMLRKISIGIGDAGIFPDLDIEKIITDKQLDIQKYLSKRLVFPGLKMKWEELGITLEVMGSLPAMSHGQYAICQEVVVELFPVVKSAFNGILLIDTSKSMEERDVVVDDKIHNALQQLHAMAEEMMPNIKVFIEQIEAKSIARRLDSAILSAMLYFAEKVARGKGEKIAIVTYSDFAEPIEFTIGGAANPWLDVSKGGLEERKEDVSMLLGSNLLLKVRTMTAHHTNIGAAIDSAYNIAQEMGTYEKDVEGTLEKPVMVVLLTDGEFDVGPSPVRVVKDKFKTMSKVVIHTVGIGDDIDEAVLKRISELGHGEFIKANDLNKLLEFYSTLAQKFKAIYKMEEDVGEASQQEIQKKFEEEVKTIDEEPLDATKEHEPVEPPEHDDEEAVETTPAEEVDAEPEVVELEPEVVEGETEAVETEPEAVVAETEPEVVEGETMEAEPEAVETEAVPEVEGPTEEGVPEVESEAVVAETEPEVVEGETMEAEPEVVEGEAAAAETEQPEVVEGETMEAEPEAVETETEPEVVEGEAAAAETEQPEVVEGEAVEAEPEAVETEAEPEVVEGEAVEAEPEAREGGVEAETEVPEGEPEVVEADTEVPETEPEAVVAVPEVAEAEPEAVVAVPEEPEAEAEPELMPQTTPSPQKDSEEEEKKRAEKIRQLAQSVQRPEKRVVSKQLSWAKLKEKAEKKRHERGEEKVEPKEAKAKVAEKVPVEEATPVDHEEAPKDEAVEKVQEEEETPEESEEEKEEEKIPEEEPEVEKEEEETPEEEPEEEKEEEEPPQEEPDMFRPELMAKQMDAKKKKKKKKTELAEDDEVTEAIRAHREKYLKAASELNEKQLLMKLKKNKIEFDQDADWTALARAFVDGVIGLQIIAARSDEDTDLDPFSADFGLAFFKRDKKKVGRGLAALIRGKK